MVEGIKPFGGRPKEIWVNRRRRIILDSSSGTSNTPEADYSNVEFLEDWDGTDGATTQRTELSQNAGTVSFVGNAELDTAQFKFGSASLLVDGVSGSGCTLPDTTGLAIGAGEFCIEAHVRFAALPTTGNYVNILSQYDATLSQRGWFFGILNTSGTYYGRFAYSTNGTNLTIVVKELDTQPGLNTWYHYAATRDASDDLRMFSDGTLAYSVEAAAATFHDSTALIGIGGLTDNGAMGAFNVNGHIDNTRITVGEAVYSSNFEPPTSAFPES